MTRRLVSYGLRADDQARVDACVAEIAEITGATHHDGPLPEDAGDGAEALILARFDPEAAAGSTAAGSSPALITSSRRAAILCGMASLGIFFREIIGLAPMSVAKNSFAVMPIAVNVLV